MSNISVGITLDESITFNTQSQRIFQIKMFYTISEIYFEQSIEMGEKLTTVKTTARLITSSYF